jgi:hypothetical protein
MPSVEFGSDADRTWYCNLAASPPAPVGKVPVTLKRFFLVPPLNPVMKFDMLFGIELPQFSFIM